MKSKKKYIILFVAIAVMVLAIFTKVVYAYFTTYATTSGKQVINVDLPSIWQSSQGTQTFTIDDSESAYIRMKIMAPESVIIEKKDTENWYWNGDYLYYKNIVNIGDKISMPTLSINDSNAVNTNYNIIASIEAIKVVYDENGNEVVDWDFNIINYLTN